MAEITTPISPIPTGPLIPQEYQDLIDQARRRQQLAQMLQAQAMQNRGPQQIGPVAARISPLAGLANIAQAGLGGYLDSQAASDASAAKTAFETDQAKDLQRIYSLPEEQQPQAAITSKFPINQAIGRTLQQQMEKRRGEAAKLIEQSGDPGAAMGVLNGTLNPKAYVPKEYPQPEIFSQPDPNDPSGKHQVQYIRSYDKFGRMTIAPAAGNTVTVNMPGKEGELRTKHEQEDLAAQQGNARNAMQLLSTADRITQALQQGAQVGGGGDFKQGVRKFFQAVGIDIPETGPTDLARTQLGGLMLAQINKLGRQPTDYDEKLMQKLVGSIDSDPTALPQLLAYMEAQAHKTLQDFQDFVKIKRGSAAASTYPGLYDTADIGIRAPEQFSGPLIQQYRTLAALKQAGGDITRFKDSKTGQPFPANASFDITPTPIAPTRPISSVIPGKAGKGTAANPLTVDELTPEQKAQLKKMLGGE